MSKGAAIQDGTPKTLDDYFADWESHVFGFGYGTGEPFTLAALKEIMRALEHNESSRAYDYQRLEAATGPTVAWLMINILCGCDIFEYGVSPRYGWLTREGEALRAFIDAHSVDELEAICDRDESYTCCYPDACNCGPNGYEKGRKCANPFWVSRG